MGKHEVLVREGDNHASAIMKQVHELYTQPDEGVVALARSVGISTIHPPRRKVNVLVIGNHSAGKSSFINWYIEDDVQRTGVAIETQGFTFVTSGSKKTLAPIKGDSTVMLYPHLEPLKAKFGKPLVENLQTCVSVSTKRSFPMVRSVRHCLPDCLCDCWCVHGGCCPYGVECECACPLAVIAVVHCTCNKCKATDRCSLVHDVRVQVDFIDSPGLVDGDIMYPFDVNEAILGFADTADLVFVFMDPMGQALCSRTMSVVKLLNAKHFDKLKCVADDNSNNRSCSMGSVTHDMPLRACTLAGTTSQRPTR